MPGKTLFIAFEGIDGAGTTTQSRLLEEWFKKQNQRSALTYEPSSGPVGSMIRMILKKRIVSAAPSGQLLPFDRTSIALLFAADRLDHYHSEIEPLISSGVHVISDRYVLSSLAYQSVDCDYDWVREINKYAPVPDVTIYIDVQPDLAMNRIESGRTSKEIFENIEFQKRVYDAYRKIVQEPFYPNIHIIDGTQSREDMSEEIIRIIRKYL
jgi:dTMP kinase